MGQRLGQHFLRSPWAAATLADAARIEKGDAVIEIGPGTGALTRELLARGARVVAIEKDHALVEQLHGAFASEIAKKTVRIVEADVRDISPRSLGFKNGSYILAANIPYYITGEIIRDFLTAKQQPRTMALLVQKEVAERIVARGGKESILSLSLKAYGKPRYVKTVAAGNFLPPPSVDSAILVIENISRDVFKHADEDAFFRIVKSGFASKRKVLRSNLARVATKERVAAAFSKCAIPRDVRAEDVSLETWLCLSERLAISPGLVTNG